MSTAASPQSSPRISKISEAVIRIAGNSQDGIQAIGGFLARLAGRSEQEVMTFMTIPSTISGGPSIFQVRIGSGEVLSAGDMADMLLAFYDHSYKAHLGSLKPGGIVIYDSDHLKAEDIPAENLGKYRHVGVAISSLTVEAIGGTGRDKGKNVFALGLLAKMFDLNVPKLTRLLTERFTGKDPKVAETALNAFNAGYNYQLATAPEIFQFTPGENVGQSQVVMSGN
ncbi:MAG: 2-oxoacid:acceptor oxidoreductase family protein [Verrucomicrobiota bacterium]